MGIDGSTVGTYVGIDGFIVGTYVGIDVVGKADGSHDGRPVVG